MVRRVTRAAHGAGDRSTACCGPLHLARANRVAPAWSDRATRTAQRFRRRGERRPELRWCLS